MLNKQFKIFGISLLFIFFSLQLFAQENFTILKGKEINFQEGKISRFIQEDENYYYLLRLNNKGFIEFNTDSKVWIEKFDKNLEHVSSTEINFSGQQKYRRLKPLSFFKVSDGFVFMASYYSSPNSSITAFIFKTSFDGTTNKIIDLGEIDDITTSVKDFHFFQFFRIDLENEPTFIFCLTTPPEFDLPERINFILLNKNLEVAGERLINFPDDFLDYKFSRLTINEGGKLFFLVDISNPFLRDKTIYQIIIYDIFSDTHKSYEFKLSEGEIARIKLCRLNDGNIGLFGWFKKDVETKNPIGVFYYVFDKMEGNILRQNIFSLDSKTIEEINPETYDSKTEFNKLEPCSIHPGLDETVLLIFDYSWKSMLLIQDSEGKIYRKAYYNSNEIIIFEFDKIDDLKNTFVIHKKQSRANNKKYLGSKNFLFNNELIFFYNDNPKNLKSFDPKKIKTMKNKFIPIVAQYDILTGEFIKETSNDLKSGFFPDDIFQVSNRSLLLFDESQKFRLYQIEF